MLSNLKKRKEEGFTIIEVMIVLVIAGAIILIVLLAIPALQRSSRNTTIKNDASAVAALVQEYQSANNGKLPTAASGTLSDADGKVTILSVSGKVKPGTDVSVGTTLGTTKDDTGKVVLVMQRKCNDAGNALESNVNKRAVALLYNVETSGNPVQNCLDA